MKINLSYSLVFLFIFFSTLFCKTTKMSPNKQHAALELKPISKKEGTHNTIVSNKDIVIPEPEPEPEPIPISKFAEPPTSTNKPAGTLPCCTNKDKRNYTVIDYKEFEKYIMNNWSLIKQHEDIFNIVSSVLLLNKLSSKECIKKDRVKEHIIEKLGKRIRLPIKRECTTVNDIRKIRLRLPIKVPKKQWNDVCQKIKDLILCQDLEEHNRIISQDNSMKQEYKILTGDPTVDSQIYLKDIKENYVIKLKNKTKDIIREQLDTYAKKYSFKFLDKYKISLGTTSKEGAYRENMEDGHTFVKSKDGNICIFGVFDGHGGKEIAHRLQKDFAKYLVDGIQANMIREQDLDDSKFRNVIQKLFLEYDKKLYQEKQKYYKAECRGKTVDEKERLYELIFRPGSTVTLVIIIKNRLFLVNLGDSRTVVFQNGELIVKTEDHKPGDKDELKRIRIADGFVENGRVNGNLAVSKAMGDFSLKLWKKDGTIKNYGDIENISTGDTQLIISPIPTVYDSISISGGNIRIILACDGIWDRISIKNAKKISAEYKNCHSKDLSRYLVRLSEVRNHINNWGDNMTCMIVKIKPLK